MPVSQIVLIHTPSSNDGNFACFPGPGNAACHLISFSLAGENLETLVSSANAVWRSTGSWGVSPVSKPGRPPPSCPQQLHPAPWPGASEPRPAPPLPQVVLGSTGGTAVRSWLLQLLPEQCPLWLHIRAELAAEKGESGAPGDRPAAARCGMLLQPQEVAR